MSNETDSNLVKHARAELQRAGLFDPDSDYEGALGEAVLALVTLFAEQGHSGASAGATVAMLTRLLDFEPLTAITSDPAEWIDHGDGLWQCARDAKAFSTDGGVTYKRNGDPSTYTSAPPKEKA